jgi:cyanophycinase
MAATLALVGGGEWTEGCTFDGALLEASGGDRVLIVPTAAAFERPELLVERARSWFDALGAQVDVLDVLGRSDALAPASAAPLETAKFVYLAGGSPMHLRSVLKDTPVWDAILGVLDRGGVVAGSAEGATLMCTHMVDSRGGAFTVGLGLLNELAVIPRFNTWSEDKLHRTLHLASPDIIVAGVDERTALIWDENGWRCEGAGGVEIRSGGHRRDLSVLTAPF